MTTAPEAPLTTQLAREITERGPVSFSRFMDVSLYDVDHGFFGTDGAGRAGAAFLTSPEVGPLFGRLVARAVDAHWEALGRPDPFVVIEAGAGRGQLAHTVLRSPLECADGLRYVTVERSAGLRQEQATRFATASDAPEIAAALPPDPGAHLLVANELLDNLPFDVVARTPTGWDEIRVGWAEGFVEVPTPVDPEVGEELHRRAGAAPVGTRLPWAQSVGSWLAEAHAALVPAGRLVAIDYAADTATLLQRAGGWLRTYRSQGRGRDPLTGPGSQDITADLWQERLLDQATAIGLSSLGPPVSQADWLRSLGIGALRAEADAAANPGAPLDLTQLELRSRRSEAAALLDPAGLGAYLVFSFEKRPGNGR